MPERARSKDGRKETEETLGAEGAIAQSGRTGGRLPRDVGTQDELKRSAERPAGATRVTKSMEKDEADND
ncbi:hypothetical protein [Marivita hallyeonensis]|uniref:Uncharacterized protein n=1 Tax=Marivita hallyeonensis TaxID=996342 RepID=A0A1M5VS73_9RHOB|nr:hypothetical protein [Marivita hallyeonensis]SHH78028.1 hypothetical protein SAMN05443551_3040 [Marivita hallyeonensis]